ncbi:membrane dipeptidase [Micromonospora sp. WMMD1102]|uniref:membrane dipeptidase n=1 Tax=Micromonospora sp. WMMD1102 TaxID=3016105 RepID=UPI00241575A6|nr:membrane dipeptidase [Micromonospora sp. WMMD1102]MDG4784659.1 membrane dipeptidase [Micromonospora sp. WMMD1102]
MRALLAAAPVFDGHSDLLCTLRRRADLPRLRAGGIGAQFWLVFVPCSFTGDAAVTATLEQINAVYRMMRRYPDDLAMATTAAQVDRAVAAGRVASPAQEALPTDSATALPSQATLPTITPITARATQMVDPSVYRWLLCVDLKVRGGADEFRNGRSAINCRRLRWCVGDIDPDQAR